MNYLFKRLSVECMIKQIIPPKELLPLKQEGTVGSNPMKEDNCSMDNIKEKF